MSIKTASEFRQSARTALSGKWGIAVIAGLIAGLLGGSNEGGGVSFNFDLSGFNNSDYEGGEVTLPSEGGLPSFDEIFSGVDPTFWAIFGTVAIVTIAIGIVFGLAYFFLGSIIEVGYAKFNLNLIDGENAEIGTLFSYFKHWKTTFLANLLRHLYIFLWSLLCGIPGIIASYSYAMVPYIMAEKPETSAKEATALSKEMMDGNKMRLFCLELSFIGWAFLCVFTCGLGYIALTPYMKASFADFYREVSYTRRLPEVNDEIPEYIPTAE